jgi:putative peptidoglycan lipid II flippase
LSETHQILRSTRVITFITLLSRVSGYIRDLVVALLLGTSLAADAFVIAFRIPNFLRRLMAEGAMTAAFIPVFTSHRAERTEAESWDFARRMFWSLTTVLAAVTVLGIIFAPQLVRLFTSPAPSPSSGRSPCCCRASLSPTACWFLYRLASVALNTIGKFGLPASVPIFLNLAIIGGGVLAWHAGATKPPSRSRSAYWWVASFNSWSSCRRCCAAACRSASSSASTTRASAAFPA